MTGRHYGMDWLRIGAFALLILYHIGMVFVPWDFHVNAARPQDWLEYPMLALNPWRLALLFVVSGFASRNLLAKLDNAGAFAASRARRLAIPLLFGVAIVVPPQSWVEVMAKYGYAQGLWTFWTVEYFRFGTFHGIVLPTWNHLWFVVYLLAYTLIIAALAGAVPGLCARAQTMFDRVFAGWGLILLPVAWFFAVRSLLYPVFDETHALFDDWAAHALYLACFLFGMGLARSAPAWEAIQRLAIPAGLIAATSGVIFLVIAHVAPVEPVRLARSVFAWSAIVALIAFADRFLNRDHAARRVLTEAVFPFYMIHQTIIILAFWWMLPLGLPATAQFALLVIATVAGCWPFYAIGREIPGLRMLIGLEGWRRVSRRSASGTSRAEAEGR